MTPEKQLFDALQAFLKVRGKELATGPLDNLEIPIKGAPGDILEVPAVFLATAR